MGNTESHESFNPSNPGSSSQKPAKWYNTRFTNFFSEDKTASAQSPEASSSRQDVSGPSSNTDRLTTDKAGKWHTRWRSLSRTTGDLHHNSAPLPPETRATSSRRDTSTVEPLKMTEEVQQLFNRLSTLSAGETLLFLAHHASQFAESFGNRENDDILNLYLGKPLGSQYCQQLAQEIVSWIGNDGTRQKHIEAALVTAKRRDGYHEKVNQGTRLAEWDADSFTERTDDTIDRKKLSDQLSSLSRDQTPQFLGFAKSHGALNDQQFSNFMRLHNQGRLSDPWQRQQLHGLLVDLIEKDPHGQKYVEAWLKGFDLPEETSITSEKTTIVKMLYEELSMLSPDQTSQFLRLATFRRGALNDQQFSNFMKLYNQGKLSDPQHRQVLAQTVGDWMGSNHHRRYNIRSDLQLFEYERLNNLFNRLFNLTDSQMDQIIDKLFINRIIGYNDERKYTKMIEEKNFDAQNRQELVEAIKFNIKYSPRRQQSVETWLQEFEQRDTTQASRETGEGRSKGKEVIRGNEAGSVSGGQESPRKERFRRPRNREEYESDLWDYRKYLEGQMEENSQQFMGFVTPSMMRDAREQGYDIGTYKIIRNAEMQANRDIPRPEGYQPPPPTALEEWSSLSGQDSVPDPSKVPPRLQVNIERPFSDAIIDAVQETFSDISEKSSVSTYYDELSKVMRKVLKEIIKDKQEYIANTGEKKIRYIRDTRPIDVKEYNRFSEDKYHQRYKDSVNFDRNKEIFVVHTYVRGAREDCYCYMSKINLKTGEFIIELSFKSRPATSNYDHDRQPFAKGAIDDELILGGTKPLPHSMILHNQVQAVLKFAQQEIFRKYNFNTNDFSVRRIKAKDITNPMTQSIMECFSEVGWQNNISFETTFVPGHKGYDGLAVSPNSSGSWYFVEHHNENKVIAAVTMSKYFEEGKWHYDLVFDIENCIDKHNRPYSDAEEARG